MVEPRRRKEIEEARLTDVRVLIVESGYYEDIADMLLAGAKRLVITHVTPWHDAQKILAEAVPVFDGPTELARPGATYVL